MNRATSMGARRAELYADIEDCVAHTLRQGRIPGDQADKAATAVVDMLAADWGGQNLTFPRNLYAETRARETDILARWGTTSISELAREYGISERAVRKAYHRAKARQPLGSST